MHVTKVSWIPVATCSYPSQSVTHVTLIRATATSAISQRSIFKISPRCLHTYCGRVSESSLLQLSIPYAVITTSPLEAILGSLEGSRTLREVDRIIGLNHLAPSDLHEQLAMLH